MRGQVVRGVRGERHAYRPIVSRLADGSAPADIARGLRRAAPPPAGREPVLYVADLDAIQGGRAQVTVLQELLAAQPDLCLWLDAGFAAPAAVRALRAELGAAAARVRPVYGSESLASATSTRWRRTRSRSCRSIRGSRGRSIRPAAGSGRRPGRAP